LESKLAKAKKIVTEEEEKLNNSSTNPNNGTTGGINTQNGNNSKIHYSQSPYCQFQIPVMLTPS